jgi:ornithine decarboxylase
MDNQTLHYLSIEELSKLSFETPVFIFSEKKIVENYNRYKKLFPGAMIQYAMKANSEPEVLKVLAEAGSGFEVASLGELEILKKLKIPADRMIFGSSVKAIKSIKEFYKLGVDRFACDSFQEIEKIAAVAPGSKIYVRVRANDSGSVFKFSEKFGTELENVIPLMISAKGLGLKPYGISFHVGSQASNPKAWASALKEIKMTVKKLQDMGIKLEVIDIGGGFPCQYEQSDVLPSLEEIAKHVLEAKKKLPYPIKLILEPGRGIIADTAVAIANVIARVDRKGNTWLFLDLGVYNGLFESMAYQGSTRYRIGSLRKATNEGEALFELAGPTGDSPDVITREALLPSDMTTGDKVVFYNVGAYSLSVCSTFNGFAKPDVMVV